MNFSGLFVPSIGHFRGPKVVRKLWKSTDFFSFLWNHSKTLPECCNRQISDKFVLSASKWTFLRDFGHVYLLLDSSWKNPFKRLFFSKTAIKKKKSNPFFFYSTKPAQTVPISPKLLQISLISRVSDVASNIWYTFQTF